MKYAVIAFALILVITAYFVSQGKPPQTSDYIQKPAIVEHFACGDFCPGDRSKYIKKVYEGVTDEEECKELYGTPYKYIGFVEVTVCLAE